MSFCDKKNYRNNVSLSCSKYSNSAYNDSGGKTQVRINPDTSGGKYYLFDELKHPKEKKAYSNDT